MPFLHRKLRVFEAAVEWVMLIEAALRGVPPQWRWLADQTLRASGSIPLNIAEGSAESGTPQERRYYRLARGSTAEVDACLCILVRAGLITADVAADGETRMNQISAMLRGMIQYSESRGTRRNHARARSSNMSGSTG